MRTHEVVYLDAGTGGLSATLYQPAGAGPFPCVVDVHGGAWVRGDRAADAPLREALAGAGFLVLAVDFRQPPEHPFPRAVSDVNTAVRWFKVHADEYGGAAERLALQGLSSGGHLAMLNATRPAASEFAGAAVAGGDGTDASVTCVVAIYPILDPTRRYEFARKTGRSDLVSAHEQTFVPLARMEEANPLRVIEQGQATRLPPVLILQGTQDENVTLEMQERFRDAYLAQGGECEVAVFEGFPHRFAQDRGPGTQAASKAIVPFLMRHLALASGRL